MLTLIKANTNKNKNSSKYGLYQCECGNQKELLMTLVKNKYIQSCGCLSIKSNTIHGCSKTSEYKVWNSMKQRCYNKNNKGYRRYGGRGITVCNRWLESFKNFLEDMGERPSEKHSIDRINNNGNYCPENCRWATKVIQDRNKRTNRIIMFNTENKTLVEWSETTNIPESTLNSRLSYMNWNIEKTLKTPSRGQEKIIEFNNKKQSIKEWAIELNICPNTLYNRINQLKWTTEKSLTMPVIKRKRNHLAK